MPVDVRRCPLAAAAAPFGCDWCGRPLRPRQVRWCSEICADTFFQNHVWTMANAAARARDGYKCVICGRHENLEVNHIRPLAASIKRQKNRYKTSCLHHLSGLETLCHSHHLAATARQRAAGLIGKRKRNR